ERTDELADPAVDRRIRSCRSEMEKDALYRSILELYRLGNAGVPPGRTVLLQWPKPYGPAGESEARECDAEQIPVLVEWLIDRYWGWAPPNGFRAQEVLTADPMLTA